MSPREGGVEAVFSSEAYLHQMLRFEAALARAEAALGIIPAEAGERIAKHCALEGFDVESLLREAESAGTVATPLVRALTQSVGEEYGRFVHWGATSQDAMDSALVLQMRDGIGLIIADLLRSTDRCAELTTEHRKTVMAGRTLLQQAVPITFGLKAARWLAMLTRCMMQLHDRGAEDLVLQFGGAAGTLAALGSLGPAVAQRMGAELKLAVPPLPWHAERDRPASIAAAVGIAAGAVSKIAGDIVLLSQSEVGEVSEDEQSPEHGGSSAMPNKRNPAHAVAAIASARMATALVPIFLSSMESEYERSAGGWQAELVAMPALFLHCGRAVRSVAAALLGLRVNAARMAENLSRGGGAIMAESLAMSLAVHVGRPDAQRLLKELLARAHVEKSTLRECALADAGIARLMSREAVERALEPGGYLGATDVFIDRALAEYAAMRAELDLA
jgi:3-carboxy-cis,cis-muconate cycloisomerase